MCSSNSKQTDRQVAAGGIQSSGVLVWNAKQGHGASASQERVIVGLEDTSYLLDTIQEPRHLLHSQSLCQGASGGKQLAVGLGW